MKIIYRFILVTVILFLSLPAVAGKNIGFGTIKGYKIGNGDLDTVIVYLNEGYELDDGNCSGQVTIRFSDYGGSRSEKRVDQMMSTILAAYVSGKKIRFFSHKDNCDVTFVALQEAHY